jgi:hypothetical protein
MDNFKEAKHNKIEMHERQLETYERRAADLASRKEYTDRRFESMKNQVRDVSEISLYNREKGYYEQNPIYKRKISELILNLRRSWIHIYEYAKGWYEKCAERHARDNDEIMKFGME